MDSGVTHAINLAPVMEAQDRSGGAWDALVDRARVGDSQAFDELMGLTESRVLGLAWRILQDRDLARDAAQDTFLRAFRSLHTYRTGEAFPAWLCAIAVNVCRDLLRRRGPRPVDLEDLDHLPHAQDHPSAPEEAILRSQRRTLVQRALGALPEGERTALVLRDLQGFSTEDVARVLGVRPVTIRTQVASARLKLRAACERLIQPGGQP